MNLLATLQWVLAVPVSLLLAYFSFETMLGWRRLYRVPPKHAAGSEARTAILVPAHNEESVIADTVSALRAGAPSAHILVVADNCSDETAMRAREAGAEVHERNDHDRRGKGYALDAGRNVLSRDPPDCVVVIDADCKIETGGIDRLAAHVARTGGAVQAANLVIGNAERADQTAISNFAMMVKNLFRARGMSRIGGGALLYGTGMAFSWPVFRRLQIATGDATEDIALGLQLAREGLRVTLADHVRVTSAPPDAAASRGQRTRWEHGFLKNMQAHAVPLIVKGITRASRLQIAIGLHMCVPPLALLVALGVLVLLAVTALVWVGGSIAPTVVLISAFVLTAVALAGAWLAEGRQTLPLRALAMIPIYIFQKIPIYIAYLVKPNSEWNRTRREGEGR